jgi:phospholipase C
MINQDEEMGMSWEKLQMKSLLAGFLLVFMAGAAWGQSSTSSHQLPYPNPFKHVVLIIQENRTPDTLFHSLLAYPGINAGLYDLASSGLANVNGQQEVIQLTPRALATDYDVGHSHDDFSLMWDNGAIDGANLIPDTCNKNSTDCQNNGQGQFLGYKYVQASDIGPYLQMAAQYGWANYMFQTNQGPSFSAHQILFSGTTAETAEDDAEGDFVAEVPGGPQGANYYGPDDTGCLAPEGELNAEITPESAPNVFTIYNDPIGTFCFQHDSMATLLDASQLTWKYYAADSPYNPYPDDPNEQGYNQAGTMFNGANSIYDVCVPDYTQNPPVCTSPEWTNNIDLNPPDVLTDISSCNLPSVAWVTPIGQDSDHPGEENANGGPSWIASIVNAIGTDTTCEGGAGYWSDTAILVVWDDWGGWYDHVAPIILPGPQGDNELGFRVPFLVISAYTPQGYVSNHQMEFGSIIRFMEAVFDFPEGSLGFSDARAMTDLSDFFNFNMQPRTFQQIAARYNREHFLHRPKTYDPPDTY